MRSPLPQLSSLAKFLMTTLDRTGLKDPVLGTEIDRALPVHGSAGITVT